MGDQPKHDEQLPEQLPDCGACENTGRRPHERASGPPVMVNCSCRQGPMMPDQLPPQSRRSIPPVDPEDTALAVRLHELGWVCHDVAAYLPVGRVPRDRLVELADILEAITPDVRRLVERMVVNGRAGDSRDLPTHPPTSPDIR